MNIWVGLSFVRLAIFLVLGIAAYHIFPIQSLVPLYVLAVLIAVWLVLYYSSNGRFRRRGNHIFSLAIYGQLMLAGYSLTSLHNEQSHPNHLSSISGTIDFYSGVVCSDVQQKATSTRFELSLEKVLVAGKWQKAKGKVLIYQPADAPTLPCYGDVLAAKGAPSPVAPPTNPDEFDYRDYLANKQIYHQAFLYNSPYQILGNRPPSQVMAMALRIRQYCSNTFHRFIKREDSRSIAEALVLGVKDGLDNSIKSAYSGAGAMHILAVSGLHVGVIFKILAFMLHGFKRRKKGKWLYLAVILSSLWGYAFVTGLSPSVLRAVTMFSFIVLGETLRRKSNIYNNLGLAAFCLLVYNPYLLFEVGFQLSFAAVFGIVYLTPKIEAFFTPPTFILKKIWMLMCVSIAAQIATAPLALLYFHQFPNYFLLTNLVAIYAATLILWGGLMLILTSLLPSVATFTGQLLDWAIWKLNQFIFWVNGLDGAQTKGVDISLPEAWLLYLLLLLLLAYFAARKKHYWMLAAFLYTGFISINLVERWQRAEQQEMVIYNIKNSSLIGVTEGRQGWLLTDSLSFQKKASFEFHIQQHLWKMGVESPRFVVCDSSIASPFPIKHRSGCTLFTWKGKRFLWINKKIESDLPNSTDYLILSHNAVRSLKYLGELEFSQLIIDGSNNYYTDRRLKDETEARQVTVHSVRQEGAFVMR